MRARSRDDALLAVAAASYASLVSSDRWPAVAAQLLADGFDGQHVVRLAGLHRGESTWVIAEILPATLHELGIDQVPKDDLPEGTARLLAAATGLTRRHDLVRCLAGLAPRLGYPDNLIGQAFAVVAQMDCDSPVRPKEALDGDLMERRLRAFPPLQISDGLVSVLTSVGPPQ